MKKIFSKEVLIGLSGVVAIVCVFIGIKFLKGINVFQSSHEYYITLPNVAGLASANPIFANGYAVGNVRHIAYPTNGTGDFVLTVELHEGMVVPQGTSAEVETSMLGEAKVNLILGKDPLNHLTAGDTIRGREAVSMVTEAAKMVPVVAAMLPKLDSILNNLNRLTSDPALAQTLKNTEQITADLTQTTKHVNALLSKDVPNLTNKLVRVADNAEQMTAKLAKIDVQPTLDNTNALLTKATATSDLLHQRLSSTDNSLGLMLNDRTLYDNLSNTMGSANALLMDFKQHPKRYVHFSIFGRKDKTSPTDSNKGK